LCGLWICKEKPCEKRCCVGDHAVGTDRRSRSGNAPRATRERADKRNADRVGLRPRMDSRTLRTLSSHGLWLRRLRASPVRARSLLRIPVRPPLLDRPLGLSSLQLVTAPVFKPADVRKMAHNGALAWRHHGRAHRGRRRRFEAPTAAGHGAAGNSGKSTFSCQTRRSVFYFSRRLWPQSGVGAPWRARHPGGMEKAPQPFEIAQNSPGNGALNVLVSPPEKSLTLNRPSGGEDRTRLTRLGNWPEVIRRTPRVKWLGYATL
jgi:hypothetical protein